MGDSFLIRLPVPGQSRFTRPPPTFLKTVTRRLPNTIWNRAGISTRGLPILRWRFWKKGFQLLKAVAVRSQPLQAKARFF